MMKVQKEIEGLVQNEREALVQNKREVLVQALNQKAQKN